VVEQSVGGDIDALGDLGVLVADQLSTQQPAASPSTGNTDVELVGTRAVGLVVELDRPDGHRVEAGLPSVRVAQAGAGHRQLEHLDHLSPREPAKVRSPPTAVSPAMRPCLWAVVPSGR
jgi:hypothetical protein